MHGLESYLDDMRAKSRMVKLLIVECCPYVCYLVDGLLINCLNKVSFRIVLVIVIIPFHSFTFSLMQSRPFGVSLLIAGHDENGPSL